MFFYWISWLAISYFTFFKPKSSRIRAAIIVLLLLNIILINHYMSLGNLDVSLPFFYCLILILFILLKKRLRVTQLFILCGLILSFVGTRYLLITSPIWLFFNEYAITSILLIMMVSFYTKQLNEKLVLFSAAFFIGELFYSMNVRLLDWFLILGSPIFFICFYISLVWLLVYDKLAANR
ncbi:YphA family membrane protein [Amphibacillus sediminis]|uniref:YphA family membrane protein n=1 Tax=Amphibacillus sediminis TaxID=360185 RepID=UPI0008336058|nr:hypothetical protein [Amphibacillus sediminis]